MVVYEKDFFKVKSEFFVQGTAKNTFLIENLYNG